MKQELLPGADVRFNSMWGQGQELWGTASERGGQSDIWGGGLWFFFVIKLFSILTLKIQFFRPNQKQTFFSQLANTKK